MLLCWKLRSSSINFKIFKSYSANFDENCRINSKEVLFNEIYGIINSDKFSRTYDVTFLGTQAGYIRVRNFINKVHL